MEHWSQYLAKALIYRAKLARLAMKQATKIIRYHPILKAIPNRKTKLGY